MVYHNGLTLEPRCTGKWNWGTMVQKDASDNDGAVSTSHPLDTSIYAAMNYGRNPEEITQHIDLQRRTCGMSMQEARTRVQQVVAGLMF